MKKWPLVLLWVVAALISNIHAQDCSVYTLTMPSDTSICESGQAVSLEAIFTGNVSSVSWSPQTGLNFSTILNPVATVNTTTTYEVNIQAVTPENLIFNGDFSLGDVGFTTDYNYGNGGSYGILSDEGDYAIASNANDTHTNFASCEDHTGGGNMMVINGSGQPDDVWCQNVTVQPNTLYSFSAWVATVISENPANLQFSINGNLLGDQFDATILTCTWQQFAETWFSGSSTNAQICVVNVNEELDGNDFAIDDLAFSPVCTYTDEVTITVGEAPAAPVVNCDATSSSIQLNWDEVLGADSYTVNVLNAPAGSFQGSTEYLVDGLSPAQTVNFEVIAVSPDGCTTSTSFSCSTLNCPDVSVTLDAPNAVCDYNDDFEFTVTIDSDHPGPYQLSLFNGQNTLNYNNLSSGTNSFTLSISDDMTLEITSLTIVDAANCTVSNLPPAFSIAYNEQPSAGVAIGYANCPGENQLLPLVSLLQLADEGGTWSDISSSPAAFFISDDDVLNMAESTSGFYQFEYSIDAPPGCVDQSETVNVTIYETPVADAGTDQALNCSTLSVNLGGTGTSIADTLEYNWVALNGGILTIDNMATSSTSNPGTYVLTVIEPEHSCSDTDTIIIEEIITDPVPVFTILPASCDAPSSAGIVVDTVVNGNSPYQYALDNGSFSDNSQFLGLDAGVHTLMVIDANGCEGLSSLEIPQINELDIEIINHSSNDDQLYVGDVLNLQAYINKPDAEIASIIWSPTPPDTCANCLNVSFLPESSQVYQVTVTDINGCSSSAQISVRVTQRSRYYVPTAFSPNEDGRNDVLYVNTGPEFIGIKEFSIFDRWGNMVFQQKDVPPNDPNYGWDGTFNGETAPINVYGFMLTLIYSNGKELNTSGEINLVR